MHDRCAWTTRMSVCCVRNKKEIETKKQNPNDNEQQRTRDVTASVLGSLMSHVSKTSSRSCSGTACRSLGVSTRRLARSDIWIMRAGNKNSVFLERFRTWPMTVGALAAAARELTACRPAPAGGHVGAVGTASAARRAGGGAARRAHGSG